MPCSCNSAKWEFVQLELLGKDALVMLPSLIRTNSRRQQEEPIEYYSNQSVNAVRWNDNIVVTMLTNFDHTLPVKHVQRHMKGQAGKAQVEQPLMKANYTAGMGGVNLLDRIAYTGRLSTSNKKEEMEMATMRELVEYGSRCVLESIYTV